LVVRLAKTKVKNVLDGVESRRRRALNGVMRDTSEETTTPVRLLLIWVFVWIGGLRLLASAFPQEWVPIVWTVAWLLVAATYERRHMAHWWEDNGHQRPPKT
jgi:hypothetical protein